MKEWWAGGREGRGEEGNEMGICRGSGGGRGRG